MSLSLSYNIAETEIWHCFFDVLSVYAILMVCGGTVLSVALVWIITLVSMIRLINIHTAIVVTSTYN